MVFGKSNVLLYPNFSFLPFLVPECWRRLLCAKCLVVDRQNVRSETRRVKSNTQFCREQKSDDLETLTFSKNYKREGGRQHNIPLFSAFFREREFMNRCLSIPGTRVFFSSGQVVDVFCGRMELRNTARPIISCAFFPCRYMLFYYDSAEKSPHFRKIFLLCMLCKYFTQTNKKPLKETNWMYEGGDDQPDFLEILLSVIIFMLHEAHPNFACVFSLCSLIVSFCSYCKTMPFPAAPGCFIFFQHSK